MLRTFAIAAGDDGSPITNNEIAMIHTYKLDGMHCGSCVARVQTALERVAGVKKVIVSLNPPEAVVSMTGHISTDVLDKAVQSAGAYALSDAVKIIDTMHGHTSQAVMHAPARTTVATAQFADLPNATIATDLAKPSATTYKPLLIILAYLLGITVLVEVRAGAFDGMRAMSTFMAGFFLTFSFFKLLDIPGFASSYRMYDIVAKRMPAYGSVYPFIELALGVAYLTGWNPVATNVLTLIVMGISLVGVVQSVLNKSKIRCACLGSVFNLPMTTVTIAEDGLMLAMAGAMLFIGL